MMKPNLTIFDGPLLYTEGLSQSLVDNKIFQSVNLCNSYDSLKLHIEDKSSEFLLLSYNTLLLSEIYTIAEEIISINSSTKIIVIGNSFDVIVIRKLFNKGIKSYLDKNSSYTEFLKCTKALSANEIYVCDFVKELMINFISSEQDHSQSTMRDTLTKRELEILKHICNGLSSKDIGEKLFISINTVETHRKRILMKLNVKNSVGVVKYALENNIIS